MSTAEIIEGIKALPEEEKARVFAFMLASRGESEGVSSVTDNSAREAGEWVIKNYGELLHKLAQ